MVEDPETRVSQSAELSPLLSPLASFCKDEQMWGLESLLRGDSGGVPGLLTWNFAFCSLQYPSFNWGIF